MRAIFHFVTHRWRAVALVTVGALAGGTVWAVAAVPGTGGTVTVCYETTSTGAPVETTPNLTLIDPSAGQSCSHIVSGGANSVPLSAAELTLNQTGPAGPAGAPGAAGVAGATGATGATGPAASVTPTAIGTITFKPAHRGSVGTGTAPIVATVVSLTVGTKVSHGTLTVVLKDNGPALLKELDTLEVFPSVKISVSHGRGMLATYTLKNATMADIQIAGASSVTTQTDTLRYESLESQF
jgi:hypothetical protein